MFPTIPFDRKAISALQRLALADEGADVALAPSLVSTALRGELSPSLLYLQIQQQSAAARRSSLVNELLVNPRLSQQELLMALFSRDSLREALMARHRTFPTSFESVASSALLQAHRNAIVTEAYQRGRDEAVLSLLSSSMEDLSAAQKTAALKPATEGQPESLASLRVKSPTPQAPQITKRSKADDTGQISYFDASSLEDPDEETLAKRRTRGGVTEPFPERMHRLLQDCEDNGETEVISFLPHGRAFMIYHVERFCREVMPRYFKQSRLSSFQRQLNLYGFRRITSGPDAGGYYHELFLKGRPALAIHMRRVGIPKADGGIRPSPRPSQYQATPDFYAMAPVGGKSSESEPVSGTN